MCYDLKSIEQQQFPFMKSMSGAVEKPPNEQKLQHVITTRLLELLNASSMLATDATYKLTQNSFPVMLIGITDKSSEGKPLWCCCLESRKRGKISAKFLSPSIFLIITGNLPLC